MEIIIVCIGRRFIMTYWSSEYVLLCTKCKHLLNTVAEQSDLYHTTVNTNHDTNGSSPKTSHKFLKIFGNIYLFYFNLDVFDLLFRCNTIFYTLNFPA